MRRYGSIFILAFLLHILPFHFLNAQDRIIHDIVLKGNNHTRSVVILREIAIQPGDVFSVSALQDLLNEIGRAHV